MNQKVGSQKNTNRAAKSGKGQNSHSHKPNVEHLLYYTKNSARAASENLPDTSRKKWSQYYANSTHTKSVTVVLCHYCYYSINRPHHTKPVGLIESFGAPPQTPFRRGLGTGDPSGVWGGAPSNMLAAKPPQGLGRSPKRRATPPPPPRRRRWAGPLFGGVG